MPDPKLPTPFPVDGESPLAGVTVLITRALDQAPALAAPLAALGARVVLTPSIRLVDPPDWSAADEALRNARSYDWAILTSVNGVEAVERRLGALGLGWDLLSGSRLAAIGPATAEALKRRGLEVAVVPEVYQAEGILEALGTEPLKGKRILLARAETAREILPEVLRGRGARVDVVAVYRTVGCDPSLEAVEALSGLGVEGRTVVTFTSSSTVASFLDRLPAAATRGLRGAVIAAIGPITAETLRRRGIEPSILPGEFTIPALVEAIREHFR